MLAMKGAAPSAPCSRRVPRLPRGRRPSAVGRPLLGTAIAALIIGSSTPARAQDCVGDCDGDGSVVVAELVQGVGISLGSAPLERCPAIDASGDGSAEVSELIAAVNGSLRGCGNAAFLARYAATRAEAQTLTPAELAGRYPAPAAVDALGYDPLAAARLDEITAALDVSGAQRDLLQHNGFVVLADQPYHTFGVGYETLYAQHMPVFVSADSLLHAWHRSYDSILRMLEVTALIGELRQLLDGMHATLESKRAAGHLPDALRGAARDVDIYLAVARTLLDGQRVAAHFGAEAEAIIDEIVAAVASRQPAPLPLFGRSAGEPYDFSQFEPRGHYADTAALRQYFQAFMWIGRTEMVLVRYDGGTPRFDRAAFDAAALLHALVHDSGQRTSWDRINLVIERMVGEKDSMDPTDFDAFTAATGLTDLAAVAAAGDDALRTPLLASPYGLQRIMSRILFIDPDQPTLQLPRVFLLLGQRFAIDSYVFHRVTYDRLIDPDSGEKTRRMLPSELDVQFALGSNTAGALLADELARFHHQGALHELRFLIDAHPPQFWDANLYNGWLDAIRRLNEDLAQPGRPQSLQTAAWARKTLETQLAAWAELRHDTLLYAKQSYSGAVTCTYPDAYLEPAPRFLARMAELGRLGVAMAAELPEAYGTRKVRAYFENFTAVMERLLPIAERELAGEPLADDELAFLRRTIEQEMIGCGEIHYDGWYASLFFDNLAVIERKPTIADVHTAPTDADGNPVGWVLHAATGDPRPMIVTIDSCTGPRAYVGLVSTYHSVLTEQFERLTDAAWLTRLATSDTTPAWTAAYRR